MCRELVGLQGGLDAYTSVGYLSGSPGDRAPLNHIPMPSPSGLWAASRKPGRFTITLPAHVLEAIAERSTRQGRSMSNYAAFVLESALFPPDRNDQ